MQKNSNDILPSISFVLIAVYFDERERAINMNVNICLS